MMTVSSFDTREAAEARAAFYRGMGFKVQIVEVAGRIDGPFSLRCEYVGER